MAYQCSLRIFSAPILGGVLSCAMRCMGSVRVGQKLGG
jgi:hypothetical protein